MVLAPDPAHGTLAGAAPPWMETWANTVRPSDLDLECFPSYADASGYLRPHSHLGGRANGTPRRDPFN